MRSNSLTKEEKQAEKERKQFEVMFRILTIANPALILGAVIGYFIANLY